jgi:hypothetical protein
MTATTALANGAYRTPDPPRLTEVRRIVDTDVPASRAGGEP